ncbi:MAG: hypothetical protein FWG65_03475 [Turicibacter sp.]|nr:hypothetical protein [Turicibacter sp.]
MVKTQKPGMQAFWDGFFYRVPKREIEPPPEIKPITHKHSDFYDDYLAFYEDYKALRSDWERVGECMHYAMNEFEKEIANAEKTICADKQICNILQ